MEQDSPEPRPVTPKVATNTPIYSSPIKFPLKPVINFDKWDEWSKHVYPLVKRQIQIEDMIRNLCPLHYSDSEWLKKAKLIKPWTTNSKIVTYLSKISASIQEAEQHEYGIAFLETENQTLELHPTVTGCRPDISAYRQYPDKAPEDDQVTWLHLGGTGESRSAGNNQEETEAKGGAYTAFNLLARPDLVSVPGLWIKGDKPIIFFTNASRVYHSPIVKLNERNGRLLIYAFVWHLYHPNTDPTITIDLKSLIPTFTVTSDEVYENLSILYVGDAIGRRTTILEQSTNPSLVIKEQYLEPDRRFKEGDLLNKIHKGGYFPGVRVKHVEQKVTYQGKEVATSDLVKRA